MALILVVDDEFGVAEVIEAILEDEGHRVVTAVNGRQGLARLAETRPDLVLLDVMMPIVDGPTTLRAIQADPALAGVPVVMMSSLDRATVAAQAPGAAGFLRKPFRAQVLADLVATLLPRPSDT